MWLSAEIRAYDCLTEVVVTARIFTADHTAETKATVLEVNTQIPGEGVTDSREWLRDALIGLLESL